MFLNLSNHRSADWPSTQRAAAEAVGGAVVDLSFPEVPPEAGSEEVQALGEGLLAAILLQRPQAAMVQGEFTLAFYLVDALELRGIPCYAATTRRVVEITRLEDGASRKLSRFEFVRFRRYR